MEKTFFVCPAAAVAAVVRRTGPLVIELEAPEATIGSATCCLCLLLPEVEVEDWKAEEGGSLYCGCRTAE